MADQPQSTDIIREHQRMMSALMKSGSPAHQLTWNSMKAGEELGEVNKEIITMLETGALSRSRMIEELGDLYGCIDAMACAAGIDMVEVLMFHMTKLQARQIARLTPSLGSSVMRDDGVIFDPMRSPGLYMCNRCLRMVTQARLSVHDCGVNEP